MAALMEVHTRPDPLLLDAAGNPVPGSAAHPPPLPRYENPDQDTERAGGSL
jgi:hypothetical protein